MRKTRVDSVCCGVKAGSEWLSTEQPVRHNTGHQQSLPHTGYQHGTALGTRSVLQETSSVSASGLVGWLGSAMTVFKLSLAWLYKTFTCYRFKFV